jgi:hypothetical protein
MTILALAITTSPRRSIDKLTAAWHRLLNDLFDPYRPECHYMRGPGPKWRAKHLPAGGRGR